MDMINKCQVKRVLPIPTNQLKILNLSTSQFPSKDTFLNGVWKSLHCIQTSMSWAFSLKTTHLSFQIL